MSPDTALSAIVGFLGALAIARLVIGLLPDLTPSFMPTSQLISASPLENHHEH